MLINTARSITSKTFMRTDKIMKIGLSNNYSFDVRKRQIEGTFSRPILHEIMVFMKTKEIRTHDARIFKEGMAGKNSFI